MSRTGSHGYLNGNRVSLQAVADFLEYILKISTFTIHLIDECHSWYAVLISLSPDRFTLSLNSFASAEDNDGSIEHSEAAFNFRGEVYVTGRIQQIDMDVFPVESYAGRINRYSTLLFLRVIVSGGRSLIYHSDAVLCTTVEQHTFCDCRFPRIDMGNNSDVAKLVDLTRHVRDSN